MTTLERCSDEKAIELATIIAECKRKGISHEALETRLENSIIEMELATRKFCKGAYYVYTNNL